jgi:hypothetical protein
MDTATTPLAGPRERTELRPVRSPDFGVASESRTRQGNSTITISTIVLVLAIVILVLLIR